jgi:hypothetical protein
MQKFWRKWPRRIIFTHAQSVSTVLEFLNNHMGARNRVGIGLSYRPTRLYSLAELVLGIGLLKSLKIWALVSFSRTVKSGGGGYSAHLKISSFGSKGTCEVVVRSFEFTWSFDARRIFDPTGDLCRAGNSSIPFSKSTWYFGSN